MSKPSLCLLLVAAAFSQNADLVTEVRAVAGQGNFAKAGESIQAFEKAHGRTPESILATSWIGRAALAQKKYDDADRYAAEAYDRVQKALKTRKLDQEPKLPLALGAAIEVQAQVLAARNQRTEAISFLQSELKKYGTTSIHARIRKNINLLSLEGKAAPGLQGVSVPKGKPALLFFWAHWCGDCRAEAPILERLKDEFGPKGLVLIGPTQRYGYIGSKEDVPASEENAHIEKVRAERFARLVSAPALINEKNFLTYGVSTTPTLTLIDRGGIVRLYHPGSMTYEELKPAIEKLIQTP